MLFLILENTKYCFNDLLNPKNTNLIVCQQMHGIITH